MEKLRKWIKNNLVTIQGVKYYDNDDFVDEIVKQEKISRASAIKKANYYKSYYNIDKGYTALTRGKAKILRTLSDGLKDNKAFKDLYKDKHGAKKLIDLTKDESYTLVDRLEKVKRYEKIIPKNAITLEELANKLNVSKQTINKYTNDKTVKESTRAKLFNKLFPSTVLPNVATYYDATDLKKRLKEFKNFADRDLILDDTIKRVNKFKNSKVIQNYLDGRNPLLWTKKGRSDAIKVLGGATPYQASYAMSTLARAYDGDKIRGIDVKPDKAKAKFIFESLTDLQERDPWSAPVYAQGLRQVDKQLKGVGTFKRFKDTYTEEMNKIFDEMGIDKKYRTSINEIVSVKGAYRNQIAPYAAFVDLTRSDLNRYIAGQQADLSTAMAYLDRHKNDLQKFQRKIKLFNEQTNPKRLARIADKFGQEAADQVRLASIVEGTDVESIYKKADLDRYAEKGLDLRKLAKEKGYFLDVKGARPFFEVTKDDLRKAVSALGKGEQLRFCNALNEGGLAVPGCAKAIEKNPVKAATILSEADAPTSKMQMVKTFATNFLKSPGLRTFGIAGTVGAVGAQVVKEFRNDDPTSYLSNEDQQKSMLVAMATDPITTEFDRPAILDYQLPALGATVAGATALGAPSTIKASRSRGAGIEMSKRLGGPRPGVTKTGLRVLGRGLGLAATPAALLPFAAADLAGQIAEGDSAVDIATDPINYIAPIFADQTDKITRGLNPTLRKLSRLNLGKAALRGISRGGIAGLGLSLGIEGLRLLDD
jgi:transcriptional regulator with XRE-family HTH domain